MPNTGDLLDEGMKCDLLARLRRIEGQVRGIQRMIEEGRGCEEVVTQLAALKAATVQVGMAILGSHLAGCIEKKKEAGQGLDDALKEFLTVFTKFS